MKNQVINEIQRKMLPYLNNEQLLYLKAVLETSLQGVVIEKGEEQPKAEERDSAAAVHYSKTDRGLFRKNTDLLFEKLSSNAEWCGKITAANYNGRFAKVSDGLSDTAALKQSYD